MRIGGLLPFSLCEFRGHTAAVVFTQGCNFRCPFCHNGGLIPADASEQPVSEAELDRFLCSRQGQLDGVVVSGGEPTLQSDLPDFLLRAKRLGFAVKLDTNGSRPDVLRALLKESLVDYVAMDVKAPFDRYDDLAGVPVEVARVQESMAAIASSGLPHVFRTTVVPSLLDDEDIAALLEALPPGSPHRLQAFRPGAALDPALRQTHGLQTSILP
jgi:pyruvate formate lyase activating enzyme